MYTAQRSVPNSKHSLYTARKVLTFIENLSLYMGDFKRNIRIFFRKKPPFFVILWFNAVAEGMGTHIISYNVTLLYIHCIIHVSSFCLTFYNAILVFHHWCRHLPNALLIHYCSSRVLNVFFLHDFKYKCNAIILY